MQTRGFAHDHARAAFGNRSVKGKHAGTDLALLGKVGGSGNPHDPVLACECAERNGRKQQRETGVAGVLQSEGALAGAGNIGRGH